MSEFTPGPWMAVPQHVIVVGQRDSNGINIMASNGETIVGDEGIYAGETDEANARLIAAAPEMAELLEQFLSIMALANWEGDQTALKARALLERINK